MFDGSSIAGWKAIHELDMNLMPDPASASIDPFYAETTLVLVCDVLETDHRVSLTAAILAASPNGPKAW